MEEPNCGGGGGGGEEAGWPTASATCFLVLLTSPLAERYLLLWHEQPL